MEDLRDMLIAILEDLRGRWTTDITDKVFLRIQNDAGNLSRYEQHAEINKAATNRFIGRFIRQYTGYRKLRRCFEPQSSLIQSYSRLGD